MFGLDPIEILIIGAVALMAIGPKDLPRVMKTVARWIGTGRKMAREFQGHVDELVREADLEELRVKMRNVATQPLGAHIESLVDPDRVLRQALTPPDHENVPVGPGNLAPPALYPETLPPTDSGDAKPSQASHGT